MVTKSWSRRRALGAVAASAAIIPAVNLGRELFTTLGDGYSRVRTLSGRTMGTFYRVKIIARHSSLELAAIKHVIENALDRVDALMSTHRLDSELSRFNRSGSQDWQSLSDDTSKVMRAALSVRAQSMGAFDPVVAPFVDQWGFGALAHGVPRPLRDGVSSPDRAEPDVELRQGQLRKRDPHLAINLNAIAKGDAVDEIAAILATAAVDNYLIEIGGEVRVLGHGPSGAGWVVGIEHPGDGVYCRLNLTCDAMATSGDYVHYFILNGKRYCHIIDPRTGAPVDHNVCSVSVVAASAMEADAWSTALFVLGPELGLSYANENNLAALFLIRRDHTIEDVATPAFEKLRFRGNGELT